MIVVEIVSIRAFTDFDDISDFLGDWGLQYQSILKSFYSIRPWCFGHWHLKAAQ